MPGKRIKDVRYLAGRSSVVDQRPSASLRVIGIDPGVATGFAEWVVPTAGTGCLLCVDTLRLDEAMARVICAPVPDLVIFEDARKRKFFSPQRDANQAKYGAGVREGVGSVKRDCGIWQEFLSAQKIPFLASPPRAGKTKRKAPEFSRITGWPKRTSEHSRDAAMLVFGLSYAQVQLLKPIKTV